MNPLSPTSGSVRPTAVAGRFYPCDPLELRALLQEMLSAVVPVSAPSPKAIIVPHAGYPYSGPVAASAFTSWAADREQIRTVILVGPSHFVDFDGLALPGVEAFETPLGRVPLAAAPVAKLKQATRVKVFDAAHTPEHCLEVELPFLQCVLKDFSIVPLLAGSVTPEEVSAALDAVWGGPETRIVISSDLSHYFEYREAQRWDYETAEAIEALAPESMKRGSACGGIPIKGLLLCARRHQLRARTLDLRNSGDTAGPRDRVVGYGAFVFEEMHQDH